MDCDLEDVYHFRKSDDESASQIEPFKAMQHAKDVNTLQGIGNASTSKMEWSNSEQHAEVLINTDMSEETENDSSSEINSTNDEFPDKVFPRKGKMRIRKPWTHKSNVYKYKVEHGLERTTKGGNIIKAKKFEIQVNCVCEAKCAQRIDCLQQQRLFDNFYQMSTCQKTLYIRGCVQRNVVKQQISDDMPIIPLKSKKHLNTYSLLDEKNISQKICRKFFLVCLQVNPSTVHNALTSQTKNPTASEKRGKQPPKHKTPPEDRNFVRDFIELIPAYESHYGRARSSKKYLRSELNLTKIYDEYLRHCEKEQRKQVSKYVFSDIFNKDFNLSFKKPHQDTCKQCDIHAVMSASEKEKNSEKMKKHLEDKDAVRQEFLNDVQSAKEKNHVKVITFDLQKALATPKVTTNIAFYKRQLWTFNLCLYDEGERKGYMYMWCENEASRGGQEVGSCLLKHSNEYIGENVSHLILYSDSCGGQNRNVKVTLLLKHLLTGHQNLRIVEQKFLVSGHSYNSADRCFGVIERAARKQETVATPQDWMDLIKSAGTDQKFEVIKMGADDFLSSSELEKNVTNRKKDIAGNKINWLQTRQIKYEKDNPKSIQMTGFDRSIQCLDLSKKKGKDFSQIELSPIYPFGRELPLPKQQDLKDLMPFIQEKDRLFYKSLIFNKHVKDFALASGEEDSD